MPSKTSLNRCKSTWVVRAGYQKHSLTVSDYLLNLFFIWVKVNKHRAHTLINMSVMRDFMSLTSAKKSKV